MKPKSVNQSVDKDMPCEKRLANLLYADPLREDSEKESIGQNLNEEEKDIQKSFQGIHTL